MGYDDEMAMIQHHNEFLQQHLTYDLSTIH